MSARVTHKRILGGTLIQTIFLFKNCSTVTASSSFSYPVIVKGKGASVIKKWLIVGGDRRQLAAARYLCGQGITVETWGLDENPIETDWKNAVKDADILLLPLPVTTDGVRIQCPLIKSDGIRFTSLLETVRQDALVFGGKIPALWEEQAKQVDVWLCDYYFSESLQMKNALPTVEGAIMLAMQALPVTLDGCSVAILGYGRIASLLAERLVALGADVTVFARKERDLAHAVLRHCKAIELKGVDADSSLCHLPEQCRIVFNTVPERIVSKKVLEFWRRDCVLMELASFPGGFDTLSAEKMGFHLILAQGLPGKLFPETAGTIIAQTVLDLVHNS